MTLSASPPPAAWSLPQALNQQSCVSEQESLEQAASTWPLLYTGFNQQGCVSGQESPKPSASTLPLPYTASEITEL